MTFVSSYTFNSLIHDCRIDFENYYMNFNRPLKASNHMVGKHNAEEQTSQCRLIKNLREVKSESHTSPLSDSLFID